MISLSGGLKTTGYYAKASRPPDDFHGGFAVRGYRYAQPPLRQFKNNRLLARTSLAELKVHLADATRPCGRM